MNTIAIKSNLINDDRLKVQDIYLFLHMIDLADADGVVVASGRELMEKTRLTNKAMMLSYINDLIDAGYLERLETVDRKNSYKLNRMCYFK